MKTMRIDLGARSYPVCLGFDILDRLGETVRELLPLAQRALVVSDERVAALWGDKCMRSLKEAGLVPHLAVVPPGEKTKSLSMVSSLYDRALEDGLQRSSPIVALGGGVVGDLAGFFAATYLRGVPFIQVPTTLLAQVDSSVGGKVAVNHPRGKNLIGAFYQPVLVWIDISVLQTLDTRQFKAGLAEVVKAAVIGEESFFSWLSHNFDCLGEKETEALQEAVSRAVQIKGDIVAEDEREKGLRRILNFGHTFGHALEAATAYNYYLHGEAVLVGMQLSTAAALKVGHISERDYRRLQSLFARFGYYPPPPGVSVQQVVDALAYDKKREGEQQIFILPEAPGKVITGTLPVDIVCAVFSDYLQEA